MQSDFNAGVPIPLHLEYPISLYAAWSELLLGNSPRNPDLGVHWSVSSAIRFRTLFFPLLSYGRPLYRLHLVDRTYARRLPWFTCSLDLLPCGQILMPVFRSLFIWNTPSHRSFGRSDLRLCEATVAHVFIGPSPLHAVSLRVTVGTFIRPTVLSKLWEACSLRGMDMNNLVHWLVPHSSDLGSGSVPLKFP